MATTTVSHGSITFARVKDGAQFWTSTAEPTTPDYTFAVSNLVGDTNADIKIGDIVYHSHYRYTVTNVNTGGTTVLCGNRESLKGDEGVSPTIKSIVCSHSAVVCEKDGTYNPSIITFSGQSQFKDLISGYEGWFVIELSSDGVNWVSAYSSEGKESYVDYKIPLGVNITRNGILYHQGSNVTVNGSIIDSAFVISSDGIITTSQDVGFIIRSIRCSLYSDNTKTNLVDQQRVNIAFDGVDGDKGDDGYTVILTNENHTFSGSDRSAVGSNQSTGFNVAECNVIAYFGDTQIPCTIGAITGMPTGMPTPTISNNSTNAAKFTVLVTPEMTSQNGVLNIPVTINNGTASSKTFNMKFTYSLKLNGIDATGLGWKVNYSSLTVQNDGECFYHGFDIATKEPSSDISVHAWVMWNGREIIIPTGCYVNPNTTMPYDTTIYSVYRLPNATAYSGGIFHDVAWVETNNAWVSNTYNGTTPVVDQSPWSWNEATDIILAMYKISDDESPITDAQLFIPPKKYSELVEPAKGMAIEAEKVATNYLAVDSSGIMVADMRDGQQTPSSATGRNVFIDSNSVDIRDGQDALASFTSDNIKFYDVVADKEIASFGTTTRIGDATGRNLIIGSQSFDVMSGENSLASFSNDVRVGRRNLPHMVIASNNVSAYSGNDNLYFQVGDGSTSAYQIYNVDAVPVDLILANQIHDIIDVLIDNVGVSDFSFNSGESTVHINNRPTQSIDVTVNYTYDVEVSDEGTGGKEEETRIEVVETTETFQLPKLTLSIPLDYPSSNILNITPNNYTIFSDSVVYDPRPENGTMITIEYYLSGSQPYFTFNNRGNGAKGSGSVSFGDGSIANGESSFVTGIGGNVTGKAAFSSGIDNQSYGEAGSAMGKGTTNMSIGGMAVGTYNVPSDGTLFAVGNGTSSVNLSNAFSVLNNGNTVVGGRLLTGDLNTSKPLFKLVTRQVDNLSIPKWRGSYPSIGVRETGYTPVAVSSVGITNASNNGKISTWCICQSVNLSGDNIYCYVGNWSETLDAKIKLIFKVLCIANSAL